MRPIVAISAVPRDVLTGYGPDRADTVTASLVAGVAAAGGVPVLLPVVDPSLAARQLAGADALVLAGGQDLDLPETDRGDDRWVDPARDRHEFALWAAAHDRRLPVLGLCRGLQLVNVARGGSLEPHVDGHDAGEEHTTKLHQVFVEPGTMLEALLPERIVEVNTIHHQAIVTLGSGLNACARTPDGRIEAAESQSGDPWFLGIQWHPELMLSLPAGETLFGALVDAARREPADRPLARSPGQLATGAV